MKILRVFPTPYSRDREMGKYVRSIAMANTVDHYRNVIEVAGHEYHHKTVTELRCLPKKYRLDRVEYFESDGLIPNLIKDKISDRLDNNKARVRNDNS